MSVGCDGGEAGAHPPTADRGGGWSTQNSGSAGPRPGRPQSCLPLPLPPVSVALVCFFPVPIPTQLGCEPLAGRGKDPRPCSWRCPLRPRLSSSELRSRGQFRGIWPTREALGALGVHLCKESALGRSSPREKVYPSKTPSLAYRFHEKLSKPLNLPIIIIIK